MTFTPAFEVLGTVPLTITRYEPEPGYDPDDWRASESAGTEVSPAPTISGRIQTIKDKDELTEYSTSDRYRVTGAKRIFTSQPLLTRDIHGGQRPDVLTIDGRRYEVVNCDDNRGSVHPSCVSIAFELQNQEVVRA